MIDFFAALYEWWGFSPFYSTDLGDHLRGFDATCTDFIGTPWYSYIGWIMIAISVGFYVLQYHIVDSPRFMRRYHWWIVAAIVFGLNFLVALALCNNSLYTACPDLHISTADCIGFAFSNAIWGFLVFLIITTIPFVRSFSTNCRYTTFWKP